MIFRVSLSVNFLTNRKQRVVLNFQRSSCADIKASGPQGSILGPVFPFVHK